MISKTFSVYTLVQEVLTWETESDYDKTQEAAGVVADELGDHAGTTTLGGGYDLGSLTRGLVAYYSLDEGSGSTAGDATELGNDGTISGAVWNGSGQVGSDSLDFDGSSGDYVNCGSDNTLHLTDEFTIAVWANADGYSHVSYPRVASKRDASNNVGPELQIDNSGSTPYLRFINGDASIEFNGGTGLPTGSWYHAAVTYSVSNDEVVLWYNGSSDGSSTGISSLSSHSGVALHIGERTEQDGYVFDGRLDDVRVYDRALSQPEIEALAGRTSTSTVTAGDTA